MKLFGKNEFFLLEEVVRKNFASKYKGSVLGIMWSVLKPLFIMIILTIVFSTLFKRNVANFPVYILSGKCIYDFFSLSVGVSMNTIRGNKNILQKTAAPKYVFVLGGVVSEFINFLITLIILMGVMIATKATFYFSIMPFSIIPIISVVLLVTGIGLILSILVVYYTDVQHLWNVLTQIIFYSSAIFYPMDIIPEVYRQYLILNPLFWIIDQFRDFIYLGVIPNTIYMLNSLILSLIILVLGIIIFMKYEKQTSLWL